MNKYSAVKTEIDGIVFASKKEARRYQELKLLQKAKKIHMLELQPKFPIVINKVKVCTYIADFEYMENGFRIIEDVKGMKTPVYRLKKKLVQAVYGIEVKEI